MADLKELIGPTDRLSRDARLVVKEYAHLGLSKSSITDKGAHTYVIVNSDGQPLLIPAPVREVSDLIEYWKSNSPLSRESIEGHGNFHVEGSKLAITRPSTGHAFLRHPGTLEQAYIGLRDALKSIDVTIDGFYLSTP